MTTNDGDTPLKIVTEEYNSLKEEDKETEKGSQLTACLHYLTGKTFNPSWTIYRHIGHPN